MDRTLTRRGFLKATGSTAALTLLNLRFAPAAESAAGIDATGMRKDVGYRSVEDIYRQKWTWDRVVKGTHHSNCGFQRCAWNATPSFRRWARCCPCTRMIRRSAAITRYG